MRRIVLLALNDLRRTVRDRMSFFWMLAFPILLMWLFGQLPFGGSTEVPRVRLAVVDHDGGWLARAFVDELAQPPVSLRELEPEQAAEVGPRSRVLHIPRGFTAGVVAGNRHELRLVRGPDASADFSLAAEVRIVRTIVRTIGRLVELAPSEPDGAVELETAFHELARREPLVRLEVSTAGAGRPVPSGAAQSVPGILTMTVLMMTVMYGAIFLSLDRRSGMLRRQETLPLGPMQIFVGKVLGRLLLAGLQIVALLAAGRWLFGLSYGRSPIGLTLLLVCYAASVAGLATMLGTIARTPGQAEAFGWLISMVLAALGGCWWPSEIMPRWLWQAAHVLPTAWAMDAFHALISFGRGVEAVWLPSLVLLGFGAVFAGVGAKLLRGAGI